MTARPPLPLVSYKIRIRDRHVRAVPAYALDGSPFGGPGVDLLGPEADLAIEAASPVLAWLDAREPGVAVRSISVHTSGPRVLVSLEPGPADRRPRALRFDHPSATELRVAAAAAEHLIGDACIRALEKRRSRE